MSKKTKTKTLNNHQVVVGRATAHFSSGPLPPPVVLEQYDQIVSGAAERILTMAESQSKHRREIESMVIGSDIKNSKLGLVFGLIIGLAGILATVTIAIFGHPVLSGVIGFSTLSSLVGVFVYGSRERRQEREGAKRVLETKK
ncbi:DUF2335 domain-containing protein [Patescibacteria group bacterium]|nr:DUF2335 domain-containing protein [Patescibacteria group bacterium]MBU2579487.1 DUF2335 domain-containing protein [Patescibacteria group bacterium]